MPGARSACGTSWLMARHFNGYGESMVDYNHKLDAQFRFGLAIAP